MLLARRTSSSSFPQKARWARRDGEAATRAEQSQSHAPYTLIRAAGSLPGARSFRSHPAIHKASISLLLFLFLSYFSLFISSRLSVFLSLSPFATRLNRLPRRVVHVVVVDGGGGEPRLWQFVSNLMNGSSVVIAVVVIVVSSWFKVHFAAGSAEDG